MSRMLPCLILTVLLGTCLANAAQARQWHSKNGQYSVEAVAIAFNEDLVILKKASGDLVAVQRSELSAADRVYLQQKAATPPVDSVDSWQTWTTDKGFRFRARVLDFGREPVTIRATSNMVFINDEPFSSLDPLHQKVALRVISRIENVPLSNVTELLKWTNQQENDKQTYTLEGVKVELESGDTIGIPFFMFAPAEQQILKWGWKAWQSQQDDAAAQARESFLMRSQADAYQRDRQQQRQIEMLKLNLLATQAGIVDMWEVSLRPAPGRYGRPLQVLVPAENSDLASRKALAQHPGYVLGPVRKVSR